MKSFNDHRPRLLLALCATLLLSGCATFSEDGGFDAVSQASTAAVGHEPRWLKTDEARTEAYEEVKALLAKPLDLDAYEGGGGCKILSYLNQLQLRN